MEDVAIPEADSRGRAEPSRLGHHPAAASGDRGASRAPTQVSAAAAVAVVVAVAAACGAVRQRPPWTVGEP